MLVSIVELVYFGYCIYFVVDRDRGGIRWDLFDRGI